ncbi:hypothetical protein V8E55_008415 [Tylopilus felleus]
MGDPVIDSIIASAVLDSLILPVFVVRIWIRVRMQRMGWEDIWAIVAFVCGMLNVVSDWVCLVEWGAGQKSVVAMWMYMVTFTCLIWAVRISIIFSIIRIIPAKERLYIYGLLIIALFFLTWTALIVQNAIACAYAYHRSTPSSPYLRCSLLHSLNISEMTVGSIGDIITVIFPLCVLRTLSLPRKHLRLLRLLFISNIVVCIICAFRMACQIRPTLTRWIVFITNLQVAACFLVCNLLVVVTYLYRVLRDQEGSTTDTTTEKDTTVDNDRRISPSSRMALTTIELLFSTHPSEGVSDRSEENGTVSRPGHSKNGHDALVHTTV